MSTCLSPLLCLLLWTSLAVLVLGSPPPWKNRALEAQGEEDEAPMGVQDSSEDDVEAVEGLTCDVGDVFAASIPTGQTKVDFISAFVVSSYSGKQAIAQCISQCCKLGPEKCQYAWLFTGKCFTVGCTQEGADKCLPLSVPNIKTSVYVQIQHSPSSQQQAVLPTTPAASSTTLLSALATPTAAATSTPPPQQPQPLQPLPPLTLPATGHHTLPTAHPATKLVVSFAGERNLTLPSDSTHLFSSTWPQPQPQEKFVYSWEKVSGPNQGYLNGFASKDLEMSNLVAGVYVLKLTVRSWQGDKHGVGVVNVTVHSPVHKNMPPVAVISPSHTSMFLPHNSALFDASGSHDDLGFDTLRFHWEEVTGPVEDSTHNVDLDSAVLQLTGLCQGEYRYKLTVTDTDGLSGVAYATVSVNPEPYYPPQASAGKDQLLLLPQNKATLNGSNSIAYKGELQYRWEMLRGPGALDMRGSDTPLLHLLHISSTGDYLFRLTVTDSRGQSSAANVSVVVLPEHNLPPTAEAGPDVRVVYPEAAASLDGGRSSDDFKIEGWSWTQLSGPDDVVLNGTNCSVLTVSDLHIDEQSGSPTLYQFQLTVWDYHNSTDSDNVTLTYRKDPKVPPHVSAGGPVNITLPQSTAILNGSGSHDDFGIASYKWTRSESSPAAGLVVSAPSGGRTDAQPVLILSNLVQGTYNFTLSVTSSQGTTASDTATLTVLPNPMQQHMLAVHVEADATNFSLTRQKQLERVLSLILDDVDVDYDIVVEEVRPMQAHLEMEFYVLRQDNHAPMNATTAYMKLTERGQDFNYYKFHFLKINMKVCHLPCSGHGSCDTKTHKCSCSRYWMENPIKAWYGKRETNCDWSIFYVALAVLLSVAVLLFLVWLTCCCCMRRRKIARAKRRVRYILERKDNEERRQMLPEGYQQTSLMVSETDTEEEILFESKDEYGNPKTSTKNGTVSLGNVQIRTNHNGTPPTHSST